MKPKYNIGDKVWWARSKGVEKWATCQECFGKRVLTVILGDESRVTIECVGCQSGGYGNYPVGSIKYYAYESSCQEVEVNRVEMEGNGKIEYGITESYRVEETDLFLTQGEAEIRVKEIIAENNAAEIKRIKGKEKDTRTWAWNVHYHRKCLRDAEKNIKYHSEKLAYAVPHVKEERASS